SFIEQSKREGDFLTGIARIYAGDGTPLRGIVTGALAQDGIPAALLARLFPRDLLAEKRVVLHYEGRLRGEMLRAIGGLEDDLDAVFYPVEVIRAGVPRVYALNAGKIEPPQWGSVLRLSPTEAFIQSSGATPQPLHIRSEPPLGVEEAAQSVLMFTLF